MLMAFVGEYHLGFAFREGEKPKNPMVELFYGRFLAVGVLEGELRCIIKTNKAKERGGATELKR